MSVTIIDEEAIASEIWRDVVGYEGLYKVSNLGRVWSYPKQWYTGKHNKSLLKHNGKIRSGSVTQSGYESLLLNKNGKEKLHNIHRLVAMAFIDNPELLPIVNHKDKNILNNHVNNLEWCTQSYNVKYSKKGTKYYV